MKYKILDLIHSHPQLSKQHITMLKLTRSGRNSPCVLEGFLHHVRSEVVQQSAEGQSVPPGCGEVGDLHSTVVFRDLAAPGQQRLAGVGFPS